MSLPIDKSPQNIPEISNNEIINCVKNVDDDPNAEPDCVNKTECKRLAKNFADTYNPANIGEGEKPKFRKKLAEFKAAEIENKAEHQLGKQLLEKKYQEKLQEESNNPNSNNPNPDTNSKVNYKNGLTTIAVAGLVAIGILVFLSVGLVGIYPDVSDAATNILNSEFMIVMTSTVIFPVVTRVFKEKYDVEIKTEQLNMLYKDSMGAVTQYHSLARKLRDENGHISESDKGKLQSLAIQSLKDNISLQNHKELVATAGSEIYARVIEKTLDNEKERKLPIQKKQIEELIKQSITAYPEIIRWSSLDDEMKHTFVEGHLKQLLKTFKITNWGTQTLTTMFDAEVGKRMAQALLLDSKGLTQHLPAEDPNAKYGKTALKTILEVMLAQQSTQQGANIQDIALALKTLHETKDE